MFARRAVAGWCRRAYCSAGHPVPHGPGAPVAPAPPVPGAFDFEASSRAPPSHGAVQQERRGARGDRGPYERGESTPSTVSRGHPRGDGGRSGGAPRRGGGTGGGRSDADVNADIERLKQAKAQAVAEERYLDADGLKKQIDALERERGQRQQRGSPNAQRADSHRRGSGHTAPRGPGDAVPHSTTRGAGAFNAAQLRSPPPAQHNHAFTNDLDDGWTDFEGQARGEVDFASRPHPPAHAWRPDDRGGGDTARGKLRHNKSAGAWRGRKEDEVRILSSWKGPGGPWTWRVVDSEFKLDYNGFDATRTVQTKPWCSVMAGAVLEAGVHEWEVRLTGNTRACRVGVAAADVSLHDNLAWGREAPKAWVATDLGTLWHNEKVVARGAPFRYSGDIVTLRCDMHARTLSIAVNAGGGTSRAARTAAACTFHHLPAEGVRPVVCLRELPATVEMRHVYSSIPAADTGPFYNKQAVTRGQVLDVAKQPVRGAASPEVY